MLHDLHPSNPKHSQVRVDRDKLVLDGDILHPPLDCHPHPHPVRVHIPKPVINSKLHLIA